MPRQPVEIRRRESHAICISWSDGSQQEISARVLRANCPCATCKEARGEGGGHQNPLTTPKKSSLKIVDSSAEQQAILVSIWPVGNYALGILWGDNHSSGIYTYDYLDSLRMQ